MKKIIGFMLLASMLLACESPVYISGKVDGIVNKDTKVYVIAPGNLREVAASYFGKVIDSAVVNVDGSFAFHNPPLGSEPMLLEIAIQSSGQFPNFLQTEDPIKSNYMPIVWQSGEQISITSQADEFQKSFTMDNPSELNKALLELRDGNMKAYQTYLAGKSWQVEEGSELLEKEHAILQYQTELMNFADSTPHLLPALVALRWVSPTHDYERVPEFLVRQCKKWQSAQPEHPWTLQLCAESDPSELPVMVGAKFPNLSFPMLTKDTLSLTDILGSTLTIIDVWASWCGPCRLENRNVLVPLWDQYHNNGLEIIGYGLEADESTWKKAVERDGADRWYQASHLQGDDAPLLKNMRIQTIPANFVLDEEGVVVAKNVHGDALVELVKSFMEGN